MSFYISISKFSYPKIWTKIVIALTLILSILIFFLNYIVDPYNVTNYNVLNIKNKFSRDDRIEKVEFFKTLPKQDNIILGSSRVYSMNPDIVTDKFGNSTYNFAVGGASVEDNLGIILYLEREKKLPKRFIIGADFYTFNPNVPPNKYFLKNKELNFLVFDNLKENEFSKFFSIDALRASLTTLKHHIKNSNLKTHFKENGWLNNDGYEDYSKLDLKKAALETKHEIEKNIEQYFTNFSYRHIDKKRVEYYERIRNICLKNNIELYIFTTPLHPDLLKLLEENINTNIALQEFISYLQTFKHFYHTYYDPDIYNDLRHFNASTHTKRRTGDIILKKVFEF